MVYDFIQFPADGDGKRNASVKVPGAGPSGEDLYVGFSAQQPINAVGGRLLSIPLQAIPNGAGSIEVLSAGALALEVIVLVNLDATPAEVYVDNGAGIELIPQPIPPGVSSIPFLGIEVQGLRWYVVSGNVNGAVKGYTA